MRSSILNGALAFALAFSLIPQCSLAQGAQVEPSQDQPTGLERPKPAAFQAYNDGVAALQANDAKKAADKFREALAISPDFANAHCNLGTSLLMLGDPRGAKESLKHSVELNPKLGPAWATLGSCYQALGETPEALNAFNKYLEVSPSGPMATKVKALAQSLEVEMKRTASIKSTDDSDYFAEATYGGLARFASMPVRIYLTPANNVPSFRPEFIDIFKEAAQDWVKASEGKISVEYVTDPARAQVTVVFTNSLKNSITAAEGGHTMIIPDNEGNIVTANMSLLTVPTTGTVLSSNYAKRVFLHEIGHALGMLGHSRNPDDIMFASVVPSADVSTLTARDMKTICHIYDPNAVASRTIDPSRLVSGDPNSVTNRVLALNNEARDLMNKKDFPAALAKLEQARKLDPTDKVLNTNIGSIYGNLAVMNCITRNFPQAEAYFKKAIPLLEQGTGKMNLPQVMQNYSRLLKMQNRLAEAKVIDAKLASLGFAAAPQPVK